MIGIILTGHGNFATGLTTSLNLIAGPQENYFPVDFVEGNSPEDLKSIINEKIELLNECSEILVLSDLVGGTPFKVVAEMTLTNPKLVLLSGTNLGLLIEANLTKSFQNDAKVFGSQLVESAKTQLIRFEMPQDKEEDFEDEDGI